MLRSLWSVLSLRYSSSSSTRITLRIPLINRLYSVNQMQQNGGANESKRFALLVIGDEILKGQVSDANSHYLCRELTSLGHRVCEISVIADKKSVIAERVGHLSASYDYVITTGGIGPTHDDVTFEAVAEAFGEATHHHPELVKVVRGYFDKSADPDEPVEAYASKPYMRLCRIPVSAALNYGVDRATGERSQYPVVSMRNVFIFPGVPTLCQKAYRLVERQFLCHRQHFVVSSPSANTSTTAEDQRASTCDSVYVNRDELSLTPAIDQLVAAFPRVIVGSYPEWHNRYYKTRVYIEADSAAELATARQYFIDRIDKSELVRYDPESTVDAYRKMEHFLADMDQQGMGQFRTAFNVVLRALRTYGLGAVAVGFNGGKDCTALAHLVYAAAASPQFQQSQESSSDRTPLRLLYLRSRQQFPEAELFINDIVKRYSVELIAYDGAMISCLAEAKRDWPQLRAIFIGTRRTDPRAADLQHEQVTDVDKGWPEFIRVSPLLDWSYADIWRFLRGLSLPYCQLYDMGYTSLGDMTNTHPNPRLQYKDKRGLLRYHPAYCLDSEVDERCGRSQQTPQQQQQQQQQFEDADSAAATNSGSSDSTRSSL